MYRIYANDMLIYDDTRMEDTLRLVSPKLTLEDNAAGSLVITVPPGNAGYDTIEQLNTTIRVEKDGDEIWEGRVLQERKDFWNDRVLTCEGELAYLNDVILPQEKKVISQPSGQSTCIRQALGWIFTQYNAKVDDSKKFYVDAVNFINVRDPYSGITFYTDYENPLTLIRSKFLDELGGHLKIVKRVENGVKVRYIQYLSDAALNTNSQVIEFGKNLEDFTSSLDASEFATVVLPLGKKKTDREGEEDYEEYVTLLDAKQPISDPDGLILDQIYVQAPTPSGGTAPLETFGRIERVLKFDNEEDPANLYLMAKDYLTNIQYEDMVLELTALDLHYLNPEIESVKICDIIRVKSAPHNLDKEFIVQKLEIPLDSPENAKISLGGKVKVSLTSSNNKVNTQLKEQAERAPNVDTDAILEQADQNIAAIMRQSTTGHITILKDKQGMHSDALYISSQVYDPDAEKKFGDTYWKWDMNGLGFTTNNGSNWRTAITSNGYIRGESILAESIYGTKIAAQTINASKLATESLAFVTTAGNTACSIQLVDTSDGGSRVIAEAADIQINGMVTFTNLDTHLARANSTTINGSNITTGYISADRIDLSSLKVNTIYNHYDDIVFLTSGVNGNKRGYIVIGYDPDNDPVPSSTDADTNLVRIYSTKTVLTSQYNNSDAIVIDMKRKEFYPLINNLWKCGTDGCCFKGVFSYYYWFPNGDEIWGDGNNLHYTDKFGSDTVIA